MFIRGLVIAFASSMWFMFGGAIAAATFVVSYSILSLSAISYAKRNDLKLKALAVAKNSSYKG